jgi:uncharacterized membrane protein YphA (DoxX/SURF4 family)
MTDPKPASPNKIMLWTGRVLSALVGLMMLMSGIMKFPKSQQLTEGFAHLGWPEKYAAGLGITEIACTILYLIPQTSVLGAILLTGYLGGAIATHARIGEPFVVQALLGVVVWLGLFLREPRLRGILPLRR